MLDSYIRQGISDAVELLKREVERRTPEDTKELTSNTKELPIQDTGAGITGGLINETPYAPYVEYGVGGKAYNYYKNGGRRKGGKPFYTGVGARMFTKAQFENQFKVRQIIINKINQGIKDFNSKSKNG